MPNPWTLKSLSTVLNSPTDFSSKRLLIESLIENDLEELIVINPDQNVLKIVKELCHFCNGISWYSRLSDYLKTFSKNITLENKIEEILKEKVSKNV